MIARVRPWLALAAIGGVAACAQILGADLDYQAVDAGAGGGSAQAGSGAPSSTGSGAGAPSAATASSSSSGDVACTCSAATCADAGDAGDAGVACVDAAPPGWALVVFAPDPTFSCPVGWGPGVALVGAPASNGTTCSCGCGSPEHNPCADGNLTIVVGCAGSAPKTYSDIPVSDGCNPIPGGPTISKSSVKIDALPVMPVACGATPTPPAVTFGTTGVACTAPAAASCGSGSACLPAAPAGDVCVSTFGDQPCPPGFPTRYVVGPQANVMDGRTCACSCSSLAASCTPGDATFYTDAACSQAPVMVADNGTCQTQTTAGAYGSLTYGATPDSTACAPAMATVPVQGSVTLNQPTTICCP